MLLISLHVVIAECHTSTVLVSPVFVCVCVCVYIITQQHVVDRFSSHLVGLLLGRVCPYDPFLELIGKRKSPEKYVPKSTIFKKSPHRIGTERQSQFNLPGVSAS